MKTRVFAMVTRRNVLLVIKFTPTSLILLLISLPYHESGRNANKVGAAKYVRFEV